ncbi:hypothetical protein BASA83_000835 [Batrachochytrium salamandrivorans]|nr:hypothetical protein BASA83_000835 [Batrachochytrium salamandrivorans]
MSPDQSHPAVIKDTFVAQISSTSTLEDQECHTPPPDSGYGWAIVVACFVINIFSVGLPASFGVFQATYMHQEEFQGSSSLSIAFVGSLATLGLPLFAIISGRLADIYGPRWVSCTGAIIVSASLIAASFCTVLWQLFITQGFLFGFGTSLSYVPILGVLPDWFKERRGLAMGIAVSGGGVGGLAIAPILSTCISHLGWRWALRIMGISGGVFLISAAMVLRMRVPSKQSSKIDLSYFRDDKFVRLFFMALVTSFAWFVPLFYISVYAIQYGVSKESAALLVGLMNGASGLGRVVLGYTADKLGPVNVLLGCESVATILILALWPFAMTFSTMLAFVLIFGFALGGFASLVPTVVATLFGDRGNLATVTGMIITGYAGNVIGTPIAGAIIDKFTTYTQNGVKVVNFIPAIMYSGTCFFVATALLATIRYSMRKTK